MLSDSHKISTIGLFCSVHQRQHWFSKVCHVRFHISFHWSNLVVSTWVHSRSGDGGHELLMVPLFIGHVTSIKIVHSCESSILETSSFWHFLFYWEPSSLSHWCFSFIYSLSWTILLVLGVPSRPKRAQEIYLRSHVSVFYIVVRWYTGTEIGRVIGHFFRRFRKNLGLLFHWFGIPDWVRSLEASSPNKTPWFDDDLLFLDSWWESPLARHRESIIIIRRVSAPSTRLSVMILQVRFQTVKEKRTRFSCCQRLLFNADLTFLLRLRASNFC